jgi:hypothetical protein
VSLELSAVSHLGDPGLVYFFGRRYVNNKHGCSSVFHFDFQIMTSCTNRLLLHVDRGYTVSIHHSGYYL